MKLNREEIIKSLECCGCVGIPLHDCKSCHYNAVEYCRHKMAQDCLVLIKELIEENERLQYLIKELQQYNEAWVEDNGKLRKEMKVIKTDTVWKMQDRLEDRINQTIQVFDFQISECNAIRQALRGVKNDIYQIAKEILGENNE